MGTRKRLAALGIGALLAVGPLVSNGSHAAGLRSGIAFNMTQSNPAVAACLPHARALVQDFDLGDNQSLAVFATGLVPNTGYDLFITNQAATPFGPAWYQSDLETGSQGQGSATVRGVFNHETFLVSQGQGVLGSGIVFPPTHTFNLGLWFTDPTVPFAARCEPGKTAPVVTPFNGEQHAGIHALRTIVINPNNVQDGPLSSL
jgi:hypothetical protein